MLDRKPEAWERGAAGPFIWIESPLGRVWALGEDRFAVRARGHEQIVTRLEEVRQAAQAPAGRLAQAAGKQGDRRPSLHRSP